MLIRNGNPFVIHSFTAKVAPLEMTCTTESRALRWEAYFLGKLRHPKPSKSDLFDVSSQAHSLWKSWADSFDSDSLVLHYSDSDGDLTWEFPVEVCPVKYWVAVDQEWYEVHKPTKRFCYGDQCLTKGQILKLEQASCPELTVRYA